MANAKELLTKAVSDLSDVAKWDEMRVSDNIVFVVLKPIKEHNHDEKTTKV